MDTKEDINKVQEKFNWIWTNVDANTLGGRSFNLHIVELVGNLLGVIKKQDTVIKKQDTIIKELQKQVDCDIRTMIDSMSDPSPEGDMDIEEIIKKYGQNID